MINSKRTIEFVLFFVLSCLYIFNLSRSVYGGDVGDLVTAAAVWGVAHPPGYPLFTVLGGVLIKAFSVLHQTPAFAVGLISALSAAAGIVLFYVIALRLVNSRLAALIGALSLAFSYLYWFYAEIAEVFALNNFFVLLLLFLAISYRQTQKSKYLYLLSFFTGLSLTNHHTIVLLFPTLLLLVGASLYKALRTKRSLALHLLLLGLLGFSVYIYVVFASLRHPVVDWANIDSVKSFVDLILRTKYGTFQLGQFAVESAGSKLIIVKTYFHILLTQITIPIVLLSTIGALMLYKRDKILAVALSVGFIISGPFFVSYAGFPLNNVFFFGVYERFLSMSSVLLFLFFPLGIVAFASFLMKFFSRKEFEILFIGIFLLLPIQLFFFNFPKTNLSQAYAGDELGKNYLGFLPKNSMVFLSGDTNLFNTWYVRYALGFRPDILLLNGGNLTQANTVFEKNDVPHKKVSPQESFKKFIANIKEKDLKNPVFSDTKFDLSDKSFSWVPYGLLFELRSPQEASLSAQEYKETRNRLYSSYVLPSSDHVSSGSLTIAGIPIEYAQSMVVHSQKLIEYGYTNEAEKYLKLAITIAPDSHTSQASLGSLYLIQKGDCKTAAPYIKRAIEIYPVEDRYYYYLYTAYLGCRDEKSMEELSKLFRSKFGMGLVESMQYSASESAQKK